MVVSLKTLFLQEIASFNSDKFHLSQISLLVAIAFVWKSSCISDFWQLWNTPNPAYFKFIVKNTNMLSTTNVVEKWNSMYQSQEMWNSLIKFLQFELFY